MNTTPELHLDSEIQQNEFFINTYYNPSLRRFESYVMDTDGNVMVDTIGTTANAAQQEAIDLSKRFAA